MVGGKELESGAGCLRDDEAVERVMPDQFGKLADRLGVLGGDAQQFHALPGKLLASSQASILKAGAFQAGHAGSIPVIRTPSSAPVICYREFWLARAYI
jgi:hypothetical protein